MSMKQQRSQPCRSCAARPAIRVKHSATPRSNVVDAAKPVLIFEYLEVKAARGALGRIKEFAAHYQLKASWFKDNADKFYETNSFESAKIGSRGGERKFDAEMASEFRRINKDVYNRSASNTTLALALGVHRSTVDRNIKDVYKYVRIKPRPKLTRTTSPFMLVWNQNLIIFSL